MSQRHQIQWRITDIQQALHLRNCGLTYTAIAVVLHEYHGLGVTPGAVRGRLRASGAPPMPRGAGIANLRKNRIGA